MRKHLMLMFVVAMGIFMFCSQSFAALGDVISSFSAPNAPLCDPRGLAWDGSNLWYADNLNNTIYKLNPGTGAILDSFASPNVNPAGLAYDGSNLWNVDIFVRTFYTVDPSTGASNVEFNKPVNDYYGLTWDGSNLWVSDPGAGGDVIVKMDTSGNILDSFAAPNASPVDMAWDGTNLWVADQASNTIYKVDPTTGATLDSFAAPGLAPTGLTFDGDDLWLSDTATAMIYEIDDGAPATSPTPGPLPVAVLLQGMAGIWWFKRKKKKAA